MGVTAQDALNVMRSWIGRNTASGTHRAIIDIYNSHKPLAQGYKVSYSDSWCDATVSAVFIKLNATDLIGGTECGVERHIQLFKQAGIWQEDGSVVPKPGWLICFNWDDGTQPNDGFADHIGMVESVEGNKIMTIEGNCNGMVARRTLSVGSGYIRGYAMPKYSPASSGTTGKKGVTTVAKRVIDISYAQGKINWDEFATDYKNGKYNGLIIRVGYGSDIASQDDVWYNVNIAEAEKRRIPYGLYIYSYADSKAKVKSEIAHMERLAKNRQPKIGVFIDLEESSLGWIAETAAKMFCDAMNKLGYKAGVYCSSSYYKAFMPGLQNKIKSLWWIAAYGTNTGVPQYSYKPSLGFNYDGWQYTSLFKVSGITRGVDASEWYTEWDGNQPDSKPVNDVGIRYRAHCQTYGWLPSVHDGEVCGTVGMGKRMEAIKITPPEGVELEVDVHIQGKGWVTYKGVKKGQSSGTESSPNDPIMGTVGKSKRLEAIRIRCTKNTTGKKLKYQVHCQTYGWMDPVSEGELAGTTGKKKRMEAIKIWFE